MVSQKDIIKNKTEFVKQFTIDMNEIVKNKKVTVKNLNLEEMAKLRPDIQFRIEELENGIQINTLKPNWNISSLWKINWRTKTIHSMLNEGRK
ncbi:MAG: hypothetical protein Ta2E_11140 [Mycoplasmoidaceae bacterium]|nr:MAG: hypothetical protein Ta2E_11140 [Mycoplasmoidaceae bacterium]